MKLLQNPFVLIILGLLAGPGTGLWLFSQRLDTLAATVMAARAKAAEEALPPEPWGFWSVELENLSAELKDEKAHLQQREEVLDQREAHFASEQAELAKVRQQIEDMQAGIADRMIGIQADEARNLHSLAQTYATLSPTAAVAIFKEMDDSTIVKILSLMKSDVVGPILEEMSRSVEKDTAWPKRAALLSERMRMMKAAQPASP